MAGKTRVVILGSTGSVGRQAIEVVRRHPELLEVVGLVAGSQREELESQASELGVTNVGLGPEAARELAALPDADVVLNAIVGAVGLPASIAALDSGKTLALANKESLVAGGELCLRAAQRGGGSILPVDSEHAALAQCLEGRRREDIARIVLTASGGPFRTRRDLSDVTRAEALAHPTWRMGPKITIDSATLMNKGLEIIEAHFLFGIAYDDIGVVVHPQSFVHGFVELVDGSVIMQAAPTDMSIPIQSALIPRMRVSSGVASAEWSRIGPLTFEEPDTQRFPLLRLAADAGRRAETFPAALNAANEVAVGAFLDGRIHFVEIAAIVEEVLERHEPGSTLELESIFAADRWSRLEAERLVEERAGAERGQAPAAT